MNHKFKISILGLILISSCSSLGPKYEKPSTPVPKAYKETGNWSQAQPGDNVPHGKYWEIFNDPELNALEDQVDVNNQNIAAAFAQFMQARAIVKQAQAQYFP